LDSVGDRDIPLSEGCIWIETVLNLIGVVGLEAHYSAADAYTFRETWNSMIVGEEEGTLFPKGVGPSLGAISSSFCTEYLSKDWLPGKVNSWAISHPALHPSLYIPSLVEGAASLVNVGGGSPRVGEGSPKKRRGKGEESSSPKSPGSGSTSHSPLFLLLNDASRAIALALPLLSSSPALISCSGPLGEDGYFPFTQGAYIALWR